MLRDAQQTVEKSTRKIKHLSEELVQALAQTLPQRVTNTHRVKKGPWFSVGCFLSQQLDPSQEQTPFFLCFVFLIYMKQEGKLHGSEL